MGANNSTLAPGDDASGPKVGYHVLMLQRASPGEEAGLEPYFDYIVRINGHRLEKEDNVLVEQLKQNVDQEVQMTVYSTKTLEYRETLIVPSNNWGGVGQLGARVRFCSYDDPNENVWHVLDVQPSSPAARAGLKSNSDYIIASPEALLHDQSSFGEVVQQSLGKPLRLYVYNAESDALREVTITPDRNWGGAGTLGCEVGYGFLHRIPVRPETRTPRRPRDRTLIAAPAAAPSTMAEMHPNASAVALNYTEPVPQKPAAPPPPPPSSSGVADFEDALLLAASSPATASSGAPAAAPPPSASSADTTPSPLSSAGADDGGLSRPVKPRPPPTSVGFEGGFIFDTHGGVL